MADIELVVKIPESIWVAIQNGEYCGILDDRMYNVIKNGTPIHDNATNGDIIMTMFPNVNVYEHNGGATYSVNNEYNFNATWWNAPYQKGGKE